MRRTAVLLALLLLAAGTVAAQGVDPPERPESAVGEDTGGEDRPPGPEDTVVAPAQLTDTSPAGALDRVIDLQATDHPNDAGGSVSLAWDFDIKDEVPDSLAVIRSGPSGVEERIATLGGISTRYTDTTVSDGDSYSYWIESLRSDGTAAAVSDEADASSSAQWIHSGRVTMLIILAALSLIIIYYIETAKRGKKLYIREIAGLAAVDDAVGRATEMGKPVLYIPGIMDMDDIQTIASMVILGRVAIKTAEYGSALMVPTARSVVMSVAQEVVKESYLQAGRPDAFNREDIQYLTDDQFGYAAGVDGIMVREKPAAIFMLGTFYAESLILAETGRSVGAIQIAGTAMPSQIPFFVAACDYTLIGEELFAASAYLSREPKLLGSLKGQDAGKLFFIILILLGVIAATIGQFWEPLSSVADFLRSLVAVSQEAGMRIVIPLAITFVAGMIMVLNFFVPHEPFKLLGDNLQEWYMIVASAAIFLGAMNLLHVHFRKIRLKLKNWKYSPVTIIGFLMMLVTGIIYGVVEGMPFDYLFQSAVVPMGATMFSLLAFFVASAAFRAFRASNWRATLLLTSAFIVMLGQVPIGAMIWDKIPLAKVWLMSVPNTAGQRAVMIGAAMGVVATSLRMIFGIERSYLGGTD